MSITFAKERGLLQDNPIDRYTNSGCIGIETYNQIWRLEGTLVRSAMRSSGQELETKRKTDAVFKLWLHRGELTHKKWHTEQR